MEHVTCNTQNHRIQSLWNLLCVAQEIIDLKVGGEIARNYHNFRHLLLFIVLLQHSVRCLFGEDHDC